MNKLHANIGSRIKSGDQKQLTPIKNLRNTSFLNKGALRPEKKGMNEEQRTASVISLLDSKELIMQFSNVFALVTENFAFPLTSENVESGMLSMASVINLGKLTL